MNDLELDRMGRSAAANIQAEAAEIAESGAALAELLADVDAVAPTRLRPSPPAPETDQRRTLWVVLAAAAVLATVVAGVAVINRGDDAAPVVTTDPTLATVPPVDETVPTTEADVTDTTAPVVPVTTTAPAPTTVPPTTAPPSPAGDAVQVGDQIGSPLERRVLATYTVGDGEGQLGFDSGNSPDPVHPWAPVVTSDGTVIVADASNQRWQVFRDGAWTAVPYADGMPIVGSPVVGPDNLVYALREDAPSATRHVAAYDPVTLDLVAKHGDGPADASSVDVVNGQIEVGGETIVELDTRLGQPTWEIDTDANTVTMAISGVQRAFQLPAIWTVRDDGVAALDDGSIVVHAVAAPGPSAAAEPFVLRLWADGTSATGAVPASPLTNALDAAFSPTGLVQLEDGEIVEYSYPEFGGGDPVADWVIPESFSPSLDAVPRLMPSALSELPGGPAHFERHEYETGSASATGYLQTWVRTDSTGSVDGYVQINTKFGPSLLAPSDGDVDVPGWDKSYFVTTEAPFQNLHAHTATRTLIVATAGLSREETHTIATSAALDQDGAGWAVPVFEQEDGWTSVAEGWQAYGAARGVIGFNEADGIAVEWSVSWGIPDMLSSAGIYGTAIQLVEVDGHPALVSDIGHARQVTWSPDPEVVVAVGSVGSVDELLAIAESLEEVDQVTWNEIQLIESDGCNSLFC